MEDQAAAAQGGIVLSVKDRLVLLGVLMTESGSLADYKIIAALRDRLALSEHEQGRAEFIDAERTQWKQNFVMPFEFSTREREIVVHALGRVDQQGGVNADNYGLYRAFGLDGKEQP